MAAPEVVSAGARAVASLLAPRVSIGEVTLASGAVADWYLDAKPVLYSPDSAVVAEAVMELLEDWDISPDAFGSVGYGGLPVAVLCAVAAGTPSFAVRSEAKDHGFGGLIVGELRSSPSVVLIDDVLTTGASVANAVEAVEDAGGLVWAVVCVVNRSSPMVRLVERGKGRPPVTVLSLLTPEDLGVG